MLSKHATVRMSVCEEIIKRQVRITDDLRMNQLFCAVQIHVQCTCIINRRAFKELKLKLQLVCFHSFSPDLNGSPIENQTATIMVITSFVVV